MYTQSAYGDQNISEANECELDLSSTRGWQQPEKADDITVHSHSHI